jgi:hypothetical protein
LEPQTLEEIEIKIGRLRSELIRTREREETPKITGQPLGIARKGYAKVKAMNGVFPVRISREPQRLHTNGIEYAPGYWHTPPSRLLYPANDPVHPVSRSEIPSQAKLSLFPST